MPWTAILPAAASLVSGAMGADAAGRAADTQANAAANATAEQRRQFDVTRQDNSQYMQTGKLANQRLAALLGLGTGSTTTPRAQDEWTADNYRNGVGGTAGLRALSPEQGYQDYLAHFTPELIPGANTGDTSTSPLLKKFTSADLAADPVYNSGLQFGMDEGAKAINARATAGGAYDSGATLKALTRFANDYGSTKANDAYNRFTNDQGNTFNKLSGVSGSGQVATNNVTAAGTNMANNVSGSIDSAGNARAAGIVGGANAWGTGLSGVGTAVNQYQNNQILQRLLAGNGSGVGTSGYGYNGAAPYSNYYAQD